MASPRIVRRSPSRFPKARNMARKKVTLRSITLGVTPVAATTVPGLPGRLVRSHVRRVLARYARACGAVTAALSDSIAVTRLFRANVSPVSTPSVTAPSVTAIL